MSRMSTGTRSQAPLRCTRSAAKPPSSGEREAGQGQGHAERRTVQAGPRLAGGVATTTITRAPKPMGSIRRSSASQQARACRRAASVGSEDPAADAGVDGPT